MERLSLGDLYFTADPVILYVLSYAYTYTWQYKYILISDHLRCVAMIERS